MAKIKVGQKVRDTITGLEGIVVARSEYLHGCVRVAIQAQEVKDGKPVDPYWVDEPQVEVIKAKSVNSKTKAHGPRSDPSLGRVGE